MRSAGYFTNSVSARAEEFPERRDINNAAWESASDADESYVAPYISMNCGGHVLMTSTSTLGKNRRDHARDLKQHHLPPRV